MNSYALITFIILFNFTIGVLIDFGTSKEQAIFHGISATTDLETTNYNSIQSMEDTFSSSNDQNSDKRTGNENRYTFNWLSAFSGIGKFITLKANSAIETWMILLMQIFYGGMNFFIGMVLFDKWKNRKVD